MDNKNQLLLTAESIPEQEKFTQPTFDDIADEVRAKHGLSEGQVVEGYGTEGQVGYVDSIDPATGKAQVKIMSREAAEAHTPKTVEEAGEINEPRNERLKTFDEVAARRRRKFGHRATAVAAGVAAFIGAGILPPAGESAAPRAVAQEQTIDDPGITPFKSEQAKATATFGTPEHLEQKQFGDAQRSWEVEGKLSADKVGKPMDTETTDKAFESLVTDARTNADVYAQLMVGCDDKLDCTDLDKLAAEYDSATPAERQEKYEALKNRLGDAELAFDTWDNYGTTFTNAETKSVNWNNDRRTDGVKVLRVTLPNGEVFHVVTECEQLAFQSDQADAKKLHSLPMVGAAVAIETATQNQENPANTSIPEVSETPSAEAPTPEQTTPRTDTPSEETPTEEETPSEEESPEEEGLEEKDEEDNIYNHVDDQLQNGDDRFENSPETPDRSDEIEAERGSEPSRPIGEGVAEGATPVAPEAQEQNEQIQPEQGTNTELTPEQQQELINDGAGELEDGEGNNGRVSE